MFSLLDIHGGTTLRLRTGVCCHVGCTSTLFVLVKFVLYLHVGFLVFLWYFSTSRKFILSVPHMLLIYQKLAAVEESLGGYVGNRPRMKGQGPYKIKRAHSGRRGGQIRE